MDSAESSSADKLVDGSEGLESIRPVESIKCFREGSLLLLPVPNT